MTRRCSSAVVSASRRKLRMRDQRPTYPDGAYCVCRPPTRSSVATSGSEERSSKNWRASSARLSSRVVRMRSGLFVSGRRGHRGTSGRGGGVVRVQEDQIPAEQDQQRSFRTTCGAGLDLDRALGLHDAMPALEPDQWLIFLLPDPLRLPEVG